MKLHLIALGLLPFCTLVASQHPTTVYKGNIVTDTTKKSLLAKDLKQMKKDLKEVPEGDSKMILKTTTGVLKGDLSDIPGAMIKMSYDLDREEIIKDFKSDTFDNAKDRREARKEMKEDLKELKKDYKKELKEHHKDQKEMEAYLK